MAEKIITIDSINPVELFGVNDVYFSLIKKKFSRLKFISRGNSIRVSGNEKEISSFEDKWNSITGYYSRFGTLSESAVEGMLSGNPDSIAGEEGKDVIVYGNGGLIVRARTENQRKLVESCAKNDMVFAIGPAGTGKTYTAVALAVQALKNKEVRKIILTRPAVEAGENLGFLPGDLKEKLDPYLQPLYDSLYDMIPAEKLRFYMESNTIQVAPLAFMRGRTLDHAFVILDEAQNATEGQLKMFLTRMGASAKFVITGDITQVDLPRNQPSGLLQSIKILKGIEGIDFIFLDERDVIRHKLVKKILDVYGKQDAKK